MPPSLLTENMCWGNVLMFKSRTTEPVQSSMTVEPEWGRVIHWHAGTFCSNKFDDMLIKGAMLHDTLVSIG